ncbi:aspartate ammonia-lyase [Nesterenkonia aethiopica]|uniref:Aspartate ammonia-lyase n=2 Tax=Actinomycetes TaxID=1760 RepID=A0ABP6LSJ0_9MICC
MHTTRTEHDLLGTLPIPSECYYGVHTARAAENFRISGTPISAYPGLINALAAVKQAAAHANHSLGGLSAERAHAIEGACSEIRDGGFHDQFVVDVLQGGAGTSTNMNANEVIANVALERMGLRKGTYENLHPLDHVNLGQSTNDVYPTALKIALLGELRLLRRAMRDLASTFRDKAQEFSHVMKMGRTQLQDAVPMTLGQEFFTYAVMLEEDRSRLVEATGLLTEINLGGTAIGTGLNTHPDYAELVRSRLSELVSAELRTAENLIEATQDVGAFVQLSGVLKRVAVKLSKTCNDLRLTSSGPRAGLNEINLPPVQAGSSIMPGKVNPVIPEVVNQVAYEVIGNDVTVTLAAEGGQLQLNAFEPVIAISLLRSLTHLTAACRTLDEKCVRGITANQEELHDTVHRSIGLVTVLCPYIGYAEASLVAQEALLSGRTITETVLNKGLMSREALDELLVPRNLTGPFADHGLIPASARPGESATGSAVPEAAE